MPNLDQIKQEEQEPVGQSRRPAARLPWPRQPRRPVAVAGEGEALARRAVEHQVQLRSVGYIPLPCPLF
jgi:hypothetical protein